MKSILLWTLGLAVITGCAYAAFLGWDTEYQIDPVTQGASGPYEPWQVIGLGIVCVVGAFAAGWNRHALVATVVMPVVLVAGFLVTVMQSDASGDGLFIIGALMMAVGSFIGLGLVAVLTQELRRDR